MAQDSYSLKILADVADFQAGMSKIPGITEKQAARAAAALANNMARGADKAMKAAADAAAKAAAKIGAASDDAGEKIGKFGSATGKLASALSVVSPDLADAARNLGDLADGGELANDAWKTFGAAISGNAILLGTLGAAVVAAGLAYRAATLEIERINEQRVFERELAQTLVPAELALRDALQAQAVATGDLSEAGLAELKVRQATQSSVAAYLTANTAKVNALREEMAAGEKYIDLQRGVATAIVIVNDLTTGLAATVARAAVSGRKLSEVVADDARALNTMFDSLTGLESGAAQSESQIRALNDAATANTKALKATQVAVLDAQAAVAGKTGTDAAATAATEAATDATRERMEAEGALAQFLAGLSEQRQAIADEQLTEEQRLRTERDRIIQGIEDDLATQLAEETLTGAERIAALEAAHETELMIEQKYLEDRTAIIMAGDAQVEAARADARADAAGAQEATQAAQIALAQSGAQSLVDITSAIYSGMTDAGLKKGLKAAFIASKIFALAQAGINTALSISYALASPLPPPGPQLAAIAAGISGAVAFASIAAQQPPAFHSGTVYADGPGSAGLRSNEFGAILERGEVIIPADRANEPGMRDMLGAIIDGQVGPGMLASGMDRSSVPRLLTRILGALAFRAAPIPTLFTRSSRPGRRS